MATRRSQRKRSQVKTLIAEVDSQPVAIERDRRNEMKVAKKDENLYEVKIIQRCRIKADKGPLRWMGHKV